MLSFYRRSLTWVLDNPGLTLVVLIVLVGMNVLLIVRIPKGFFPQQDTGAVVGGMQGPQDASFAVMNNSVQKLVAVMKADPAVQNIIGFTGGNGATNTGFLYAALKPLNQRKGVSATDVINRLRPKMNALPVASAFLQAAQDLRIGGRGSNAQYQYTIQSDTVEELVHWGPMLLAEIRKLPGMQDVNSDQQNGGLDEVLNYDRVTAARLGVTPQTFEFDAVCGVWAVGSFDHLYAAQSVLRRARSRAAVLAESRKACATFI